MKELALFHGRVHVDWTAYRLSEAEAVLMRLKKGEIVGRAIIVPLTAG